MLSSTTEKGRRRNRRTPWGRIALIAALVLALAAIGVGGAVVVSNDDAAPTDEESAADVINAFVTALGTRDVDAVYALQAESYKRVCPLVAFRDAFAELNLKPLEGPASVRVAGDTAGAALFEVQEDGSRQRVVIPLIRENGEWRLGRPSETGCLP